MSGDQSSWRGGGPVWRKPVSWLPHAVREPHGPVRSVLVGWLTAFVPSMALSAILSQLLPTAEQPQFDMAGPQALLLIVIMAPVVETLIMGGVLAILLRFVSPTAAVLVSSLGWGIAHSLAAPIWGLVIWWPFLVFSTLFVSWRRRSVLAALSIAAATHVLQNLLPALLLFAGLSE